MFNGNCHKLIIMNKINCFLLLTDTQSYVLNFHGRVTQASVKNFQIVMDADGE